MSTIWQLCQPIVENGIKNTNFFNGRLLSAEDLQVEQQAQRQREAFLGQAIGPGVLQGLQVGLPSSISGPFQDGINDTLEIQAGTAINASGQVLALPQTVQVSARQQPISTTTRSADFGNCETEQFVPTNAGIYLLVLSPASDYRGSAPYSGLGKGGKISGCGKRFEMEGVKFRMMSVTLDESLGVEADEAAKIKELIKATSSTLKEDTAKISLLRNRVAYLFLGGTTAAGFARDPFQEQVEDRKKVSVYERYGLVELMIAEPSKPIDATDVPLALVYWTSHGVRFVDNWAVRRRTAQAFPQGPWGYALGERRIREGEAMILQFQEQLQALLAGREGFSKVGPTALQARQYFGFLPPAGLLPVSGAGKAAGIQPSVFFNGIKVRSLQNKPLFLEGAALGDLLSKAPIYPPIDPLSQELVWVYHVRENEFIPAEEKENLPGLYLAFANGHMPYLGEARYDLNRVGYSNFV